MLLGAAVLGLLALLRDTVDQSALMLWANLVTPCLFVGLVLLVFGGAGRPLQKKIYHSVFEASDHYRTRLAANPVIRWFLWLDSEGRDRDA